MDDKKRIIRKLQTRKLSYNHSPLADELLKHSPGIMYHYWYLKFIQDLIAYDLVEYQWLDFYDEILPVLEKNGKYLYAEKDLKDNFFSDRYNPYLNEYKDTPIKLAEDILNNGMYVPFIMDRITGNLAIINGTHRMNALAYYSLNIEPVHKKFLCLILKDGRTYPIQYILPWMYNGYLFYVPIQKKEYLTQLFDVNGGEVSH